MKKYVCQNCHMVQSLDGPLLGVCVSCNGRAFKEYEPLKTPDFACDKCGRVQFPKEHPPCPACGCNKSHVLKGGFGGNPKAMPDANPSIYEHIGMCVGTLVTEKNLAYGDSFGRAGDILKILYPEGIVADHMQDALTITRVIDKLFRIATKKDAFGESPWRDIAGYSLLAIERDERVGNDERGSKKDGAK